MYIFLDVDGVLNCRADWRIPFTVNIKCVKVFAEIVKRCRKKYGEVSVVVISTWRAGYSKTGNSAIQYIRLENILEEYGIPIEGITPVSDKGRQAEVEYYIRRNNVEKYIILDDDESMFENPDNLIIYSPDYTTGLAEKDIKKILKILK